MKKTAKVVGVNERTTLVIYKDGSTGEWETAIVPQELRTGESFIEIDEDIKEDEYHVTIKKGKPFEMFCTCTQKCDCQNPPPANWDGISSSWGISAYCPDHN